jgi:hypothetical protein
VGPNVNYNTWSTFLKL